MGNFPRPCRSILWLLQVIVALADLMVTRGVPKHIRSDNGLELVRAWLDLATGWGHPHAQIKKLDSVVGREVGILVAL